MSNKTRLQTNNTNLQALIDKANALPEAGGGSGGGSLDTCTLRVLNSDGRFRVSTVAYESLQDGKRKMKLMHNSPAGVYAIDYTVTDALCDGIVVANGWGDLDQYWEITNATVEVDYSDGSIPIFKLSAPANGTATIDFLGDD